MPRSSLSGDTGSTTSTPGLTSWELRFFSACATSPLRARRPSSPLSPPPPVVRLAKVRLSFFPSPSPPPSLDDPDFFCHLLSAYLADFVQTVGAGYSQTSATGECQYCPYVSGNDYLRNVNLEGHEIGGRDIGISLIYVAVFFGLVWVFVRCLFPPALLLSLLLLIWHSFSTLLLPTDVEAIAPVQEGQGLDRALPSFSSPNSFYPTDRSHDHFPYNSFLSSNTMTRHRLPCPLHSADSSFPFLSIHFLSPSCIFDHSSPESYERAHPSASFCEASSRTLAGERLRVIWIVSFRIQGQDIKLVEELVGVATGLVRRLK
jgi:hypothetical protein